MDLGIFKFASSLHLLVRVLYLVSRLKLQLLFGFCATVKVLNSVGRKVFSICIRQDLLFRQVPRHCLPGLNQRVLGLLKLFRIPSTILMLDEIGDAGVQLEVVFELRYAPLVATQNGSCIHSYAK